MAEKAPVVFKCEQSLWEMMAQLNPDGRSVKPFDMRRWEIEDDRIKRLARVARTPIGWYPDDKEVSFLNKATGELLTFEYLGVEFVTWAPGWGFLLLGKRLHSPVEGE